MSARLNFSSNQKLEIGQKHHLIFDSPSGIPASAYVFTIDTRNTSAGSSNSDQFQLPTLAATGVPFTVFWGDGSSDEISTWNQAETLHTYSSEGVYTVYIVGDFINLAFQDTGDKLKHITVEQWGNFKFSNGNPNAFFGCANFTDINAEDIPGIPGTTLFRTFRGCSSLANWGTIGSWDVSNVQNAGDIFRGCTLFNEDISGWDTSSFTSLGVAFQDTAFDQDITGWDVSSVQNFGNCFDGTPFNQDISVWDVSSATNLSGMFRDATHFNQALTAWGDKLTNVTTMQSMFQDALAFNSALGTDPNSGGTAWVTPALEIMSNMFRGNSVFDQTLAWMIIENVTSMSNLILGGALSTANYDETLIQWSNQATIIGVQSGVQVHFGGSKYTSGGAAEAARTNLIDAPELWTLQDGGAA